MKPRFSFETQGERMAYERGRDDAIAELFQQIYTDLAEAHAFPDANPQGFAQWGVQYLLPRISRQRKGDDLFEKLMSIEPE